MKLRQIRYFLTICEHRSFTGAARFCSVSQPSLTAAINALGGLLFTRGYRTVAVTALAPARFARGCADGRASRAESA